MKWTKTVSPLPERAVVELRHLSSLPWIPVLKSPCPLSWSQQRCRGDALVRTPACFGVGAGNVDFAAMFAPKPLGLTAADDWTVEMETKGFPELKQLYTLLGKKENLQWKLT